MKKKRVAIVGCGTIARHSHVPAWKRRKDVEIRALCDIDQTNTDIINERYSLNTKAFVSFDEMLAEFGEKIDIVDICTPGTIHFEQAIKAIKSKKHVLIEKPPVMTSGELEMLVKEENRHGVKVGTILNYKHLDIIQKAKSRVDSGEVGKIDKIHVVHHSKNVYGETPHLWDEKKSKYLLYDFGIHFIDTLEYLNGSIESVLEVIPRENRSTGETTELIVFLEFENGSLAEIEISADFTKHSSNLTLFNIYGTASDLFVRKFPPQVSVVRGMVNPIDLLKQEMKTFIEMGLKIVSGQYKQGRNISHEVVIDGYCDWLDGDEGQNIGLEKCRNLIKILEQIAQKVPAYVD